MSSSLGRLALGLVGAVIGSVFLQPALGFAIGSAIGGFIFAPDGPKTTGPRIGDLDVTASSLGKIISEHFGTTRAAGNVIWSGGIKETKHVETTGGKGGGGAENTTYTYSASFAMAFGRQKGLEVTRIWSDGKLIYDTTGSGDTNNNKYNFRFWGGGFDQPVDSLIAESINRRLAGLDDINKGTGPQASFKTIADLITELSAATDSRSAIYTSYLNTLKTAQETAGGTPPDYLFTPAYRELCYIVFDDMPLKDFGNRIPNITAEIVWDGATTVPTSSPVEIDITEISATTTTPTHAPGIDQITSRLTVLSSARLRQFSQLANSETFDRTAIEGLTTVVEILGADPKGTMVARATRSGNPDVLVKVKGNSMNITGDFLPDGVTAYVMDASAASAGFGCSLGSAGSAQYFAVTASDGKFSILRTDTTNITVELGPGATIGAPITLSGDGPMCNGGNGICYVAADNGTNWTLYRIETFLPQSSIWDSVEDFPGIRLSYNVSTVATGALGAQTVSSVFYDIISDHLYIMFNDGSGGGSIRKYLSETNDSISDLSDYSFFGLGGLVQEYDTVLTYSPPDPKSGFQRSVVSNSEFIYANGNDVILVNATNGSEFIYTDILSGSAASTAQIYIGGRRSLVAWVGGLPKIISLGAAISGYPMLLRDVITKICERSGLESDEFDVSGVSGSDIVRGYSVGRPSSARQVLDNLLIAFSVDGIETDWVIKFAAQGSTPIRTITESELGVVSGPTGEVSWLESRTPEYSLPAQIDIAFIDPDRDYQQGATSVKRVSTPFETMRSNKIDNLEMPIVLAELDARAIAERLLFLSWLSRNQSRSNIPWTHIDLDPADVISVAFDDGRTIIDRIAKAVVGANLEIEMDTARSGDPVYVDSVAADYSSSNTPTTGIQSPVYSKLFVLDIPLLRDYHDTARTSIRYYAAVGSDSTSFLSATIYDSVDAINYTSLDTVAADVSWGEMQTVLAAPRTLWTTDEVNTFTVRMNVDNGDVTSSTRDGLLNSDANRALIYNEETGYGEIIQFQNVTVNGDGTLTMDTLFRGLRGTDYGVESHVSGEYFILLTDSTVYTEVNELAALGSTEYFKAVSQGALIGAASPVPKSFTAQALKPYAPSNVKRTENAGDLDMTWVRRTRVGGAWNMVGVGVEPVPLNEDTESYEFYLLANDIANLATFDPDAPSTYVQKQIVGSPAATITAATLSANGYTVTSDIYIAVYQVSAQVGRGFGRIIGIAA